MGRDLTGRRTVSLSFDIKLDTAENLVEHGPSLIRFLEAAIDSAKHAVKNVEYDDTREVREQAMRERFEEVLRDGRRFHRELRHRMRNLPDSLLQKGREFARREIVVALATEFGVHVEHFQFAVQRHKKSYGPKLDKRRKRYALEYFLAGLSNKEIAPRIGVSLHTLEKLIRELRAEAVRLKLTLQDLHKIQSAQVLLSRVLTAGDEKIVLWDNLKKPGNPAEGNLPETIPEASPSEVIGWEKIKSTKAGRPV